MFEQKQLHGKTGEKAKRKDKTPRASAAALATTLLLGGASLEVGAEEGYPNMGKDVPFVGSEHIVEASEPIAITPFKDCGLDISAWNTYRALVSSKLTLLPNSDSQSQFIEEHLLPKIDFYKEAAQAVLAVYAEKPSEEGSDWNVWQAYERRLDNLFLAWKEESRKRGFGDDAPSFFFATVLREMVMAKNRVDALQRQGDVDVFRAALDGSEESKR